MSTTTAQRVFKKEVGRLERGLQGAVPPNKNAPEYKTRERRFFPSLASLTVAVYLIVFILIVVKFNSLSGQGVLFVMHVRDSQIETGETDQGYLQYRKPAYAWCATGLGVGLLMWMYVMSGKALQGDKIRGNFPYYWLGATVAEFFITFGLWGPMGYNDLMSGLLAGCVMMVSNLLIAFNDPGQPNKWVGTIVSGLCQGTIYTFVFVAYYFPDTKYAVTGNEDHTHKSYLFGTALLFFSFVLARYLGLLFGIIRNAMHVADAQAAEDVELQGLNGGAVNDSKAGSETTPALTRKTSAVFALSNIKSVASGGLMSMARELGFVRKAGLFLTLIMAGTTIYHILGMTEVDGAEEADNSGLRMWNMIRLTVTDVRNAGASGSPETTLATADWPVRLPLWLIAGPVFGLTGIIILGMIAAGLARTRTEYTALSVARTGGLFQLLTVTLNACTVVSIANGIAGIENIEELCLIGLSVGAATALFLYSGTLDTDKLYSVPLATLAALINIIVWIDITVKFSKDEYLVNSNELWRKNDEGTHKAVIFWIAFTVFALKYLMFAAFTAIPSVLARLGHEPSRGLNLASKSAEELQNDIRTHFMVNTWDLVVTAIVSIGIMLFNIRSQSINFRSCDAYVGGAGCA